MRQRYYLYGIYINFVISMPTIKNFRIKFSISKDEKLSYFKKIFNLNCAKRVRKKSFTRQEIEITTDVLKIIRRFTLWLMFVACPNNTYSPIKWLLLIGRPMRYELNTYFHSNWFSIYTNAIAPYPFCGDVDLHEQYDK